MTDAGPEHPFVKPFAKGRHLLIALAASVGYTTADLWFHDGGVVRMLDGIGGAGVWTAEAAIIGVAIELLIVAVAAWFALVIYDTHSVVTLWPKRWRPLASPVVLTMIGAMFVWQIAVALESTDAERIAKAERNFRMMFDSESGALDWSWYLTFMVVSVVAEELLFRVLLQRAFEGYMSELVAVFVQAGLFLLAHTALYGRIFTVYHLLGGLVYGVVFMRTRSLMAPVFVHVLVNISFVVLTVRGLAE